MFTNHVFVIDQNGTPLTPCLPIVARRLQDAGKAKRHRLYPFTVQVQKTVSPIQPYLTLKLDPGSKVTGFALQDGDKLIWAMELVRFDLQQMEKPEIAGSAYQQGTLYGYEVREYLLEKWNRLLKQVDFIELLTVQPLRVKCNGHGNHQFVTMDAYGFPRQRYAPKTIRKDWKAGDIVRYEVNGVSTLARIKKAAKTVVAIVQGKETTINAKNSKPVHRSDGYRYRFISCNGFRLGGIDWNISKRL